MQKSINGFARLIQSTTGALAALTLFAAPMAHAGIRTIPSTKPVVADLDLNRFSGQWFEIVRPGWSATAPCRDAVDTYAADSNHPYVQSNKAPLALLATHSCTRMGLVIHRADGTLYAPNASAPGRLVLEAKSTLGGSSYTHYDVIDIDADYRWAVVGDENRRYVWILSRTPDLAQGTLASIFARLNDSKGFTKVEKSVSCVTQSTATTQDCQAVLGH